MMHLFGSLSAKRGQNGQACIQQNGFASPNCTQMNSIPICFNTGERYQVGKMYPSMPIMTDYMDDRQWSTTEPEAVLSSGAPIVYSTIPSNMVSCTSEIGYQCNGGSVVVGGSQELLQQTNCPYLTSSCNMSSLDKRIEFPDSTEVKFTQYPGVAESQSHSASNVENRTLIRGNQLMPYHFTRAPDGTTWLGSQEVCNVRQDVSNYSTNSF